jgi:hypothetical protein
VRLLAFNTAAQIIWALVAGAASFVAMGLINDLVCPIQSYDLRFAAVVLPFCVAFVVPWLYSWLRLRRRTPLVFDMSASLVISMLMLHLRRGWRSFDYFYSSDYLVVYVPFMIISFLILGPRQKAGRSLRTPWIALTAAFYLFLELTIPEIAIN